MRKIRLKKRINEIRNGKFEDLQNTLELSENEISGKTVEKENFCGRFSVLSRNEKSIQGFVYSTNPRLGVKPDSFNGIGETIRYEADVTGLAAGEVLTGEFILNTSAGEYHLPYRIAIEGRKEEKNECLIPEVLLAMQAFKSGYKVIEPYLKEKEKDYDIIIVMGTVQGDIHDLGKNVIKIFLETLDVKIIDLGTDVPAEKFIEAIENYNANILMMSSLLTTTMSEMKKVMDMLEDRKLRQRVHVFIGGASVGESFREKIGADCYTESVVDLLDYLKKNMDRIKENS